MGPSEKKVSPVVAQISHFGLTGHSQRFVHELLEKQFAVALWDFLFSEDNEQAHHCRHQLYTHCDRRLRLRIQSHGILSH